jgi:predicted metal-dependent hydrolase
MGQRRRGVKRSVATLPALRLEPRRAAPAATRRRLEIEDRRVLFQLRAWGAELGRQFGLRYAALEAERADAAYWYGVCYEDGVIRIRLRHIRTGRLLKESSLVDTLCHEMAHLRYLNHGPGFRRLYRQILQEARLRGIYRPGDRAKPRPRQGLLFRTTTCGTALRARER